MTARKFKFVSPGVFLSEIDNSQLPGEVDAVGPIIFGRAAYGPGMRPFKVTSKAELIENFGNPIPGNGGGDIWREGNKSGPTYGLYGALAYLDAGVGPVTFYRLLGEENVNKTSAGSAGWTTSGSANSSVSSNGGAYGLFICDSASAGSPVTGALAAVWYLNKGAIVLSGTLRGGTAGVTGSAAMIASTGADREFRAIVLDETGAKKYETAFNFNRSSEKYIRKVFNTNPQLTNGDIVDTSVLNKGEDLYWLGESFERHVETFVTGTSAGGQFGVIMAIESGSVGKQNMQGSYQNAQTGWFFAQDLSTDSGSYRGEDMPKLFKLVSLDGGEAGHRNFKVSIEDINPSFNESDQYGRFTVTIRSAKDDDNVLRVIERFTNCNLNPNSQDYVARKIGDKYYQFDAVEKYVKEYGQYDNQSRYFRIEMNPDVDTGLLDSRLLPFGVTGPLRPKSFSVFSGSAFASRFGVSDPLEESNAFVAAGDSIALSRGTSGMFIDVGTGEFTGSFKFPATSLRVSASDGGINDPRNAFFGLQTTRGANSTRHDEGYADYLYPLPLEVSSFSGIGGIPSTNVEYSWIFSLDDLVTSGSATAYWQSGSRNSGTSNSAQNASYTQILEAGYNNFTSPVYGGFDGFDITEKEPFRNTLIDGKTEFNNYAFNTLKRSLDSVKDPEFVEYNLMAMPGVTADGITQRMIDVCAERADALALIDIEDVYTPSTENKNSFADRLGSVKTAVNTLRSRGINNSYAATYYPWLQARDTINGNFLWIPPSVAILGVYASSEKQTQVWYAPAGFNRGGLSDGAAGMPIINVSERLTSRQRDKLYEANINPIAYFTNEGIVVYGQKTLQTTPSALDRVNVRRLMIFIKKQVSRFSTQVLFDQNVEVTWNRFKNLVEPFLAQVKSDFGLTEAKVVLDKSTTTPDLVDRNIMYAKIFLKPARSIEFIAVDFNISPTGASFED